MQDKDEKLASENAMHSNIFSDKFVKRKANNTSNETSAFSKWVIQIEQTANILLTVCSDSIFKFSYPFGY